MILVKKAKKNKKKAVFPKICRQKVMLQLQMTINSWICGKKKQSKRRKDLKLLKLFEFNKKYIEFVYLPPFYDPQHQIWAFLVDLVQNRKFLENRQTMGKKIIATKYENFSLIYIRQLTRAQIEQKLEHFKIVS